MRASSIVSSFAALLIAGCVIAACSSSDTTPTPATGGSSGAAHGGSAGTAGKAGGGTGGTAGGGTGGTAGGGTGGAQGGSAGTAGGATGGTAGAGGSGGPCTKAEDCGDTSKNVCDPNGGVCKAGQCDANGLDCPTGSQCLGQIDSPTVGACYTECTAVPAQTGCGTGQTCVSIDVAGPGGLCYETGTGAADGPCDATSPISSRCVADYNCIKEGTTEVCRKLCDFWGTPSCGTGMNCDGYWMVCVNTGEDVAIGAACVGDDYAPCAPAGGKYTGVCLSSKCEQWCRVGTASDCTGGKECSEDPNFTGVGTCQTPPPPPPDGWTCDATYYSDGTYCDCKCGAWDPDCDDPANTVYDCKADAGEGPACISVGVCGYPDAGATDSSSGG